MTTPIELDLHKIKPNPDNPNRHDKEKIATLAANIQEFGLIHAILVKPLKTNDGKHTGDFEIIAGEGRFRAFRKLQWHKIPAVVVHDSTSYKDWGRRLSENKIRSFNWQAECLSLAAMKIDGESAKKLAKVFGMSVNLINARAAIGEVLRRSSVTLESDAVDMKDIEKHILPLRISKTSTNVTTGKKDFQPVDYDSYDYIECTAALRKLASGELTREALPSYSIEKRLQIAQRAQDELVAQAAKEETGALRKQLEKAEEKTKTLEQRHLTELEKLQTKHEKTIEALKVSIEEASKKAAVDDTDQLRANIHELQAEKARLTGKVIEMEDQQDEIEQRAEARAVERMRDELRAELKKEIKATKDKEYESELKRREKELDVAKSAHAMDRDKLARERKKLEKDLEDMKEEYGNYKAILDEQRKRQEEIADIDTWIREFNKHSQVFGFIMATANSYNYWSLLGESQFKRIASTLFEIQDEMQKASNAIRENSAIASKGGK